MTYKDYIFYPLEETNGEYVQRNLYNIKNHIKLKMVEKIITDTRISDIENYPKGVFDKKHLQDFNKYLFGSLYPWAGEFKKWDLYKSQSILGGASVMYSPSAYVEQNLDEACNRLQRIDFSKNPLYFSDLVADVWEEIWQVHPFYEGNTRTTALFMTSFLFSKNILFKEEVMAKNYHDFRNALVLYSVGQEDKFKNIIREGLM